MASKAERDLQIEKHSMQYYAPTLSFLRRNSLVVRVAPKRLQWRRDSKSIHERKSGNIAAARSNSLGIEEYYSRDSNETSRCS